MNKHSFLTLSILLALGSTVKCSDHYDSDAELEAQFDAEFYAQQTAGGRLTPQQAARFRALQESGRQTPTRRSPSQTSPAKKTAQKLAAARRTKSSQQLFN